jgi:hypothetical protein
MKENSGYYMYVCYQIWIVEKIELCLIKVPSVKQIKTKVIDDGWNDEYMTEISLESSKILLFI